MPVEEMTYKKEKEKLESYRTHVEERTGIRKKKGKKVTKCTWGTTRTRQKEKERKRRRKVTKCTWRKG
jgi:hypothetical protein